MAVWLTMNMTYIGAGAAANVSEVLVTVDANWDYKHFNRNGSTVTVTINGTTDTRTVVFNPNELSSGKQNIYSATWYVTHPNGAAVTLSGEARCQVTNSTAATPGYKTLTLSATGNTGGNEGGGSGGDDGDDSGGNDGDDSGGGSDTYYDVFSELSNATMSVSLLSGSKVAGRYKAGSVIKIVVTPDDGYEFTSCYINGESRTSATISVNGDVYVEAVAELDDSGDDDGDSGGGDGGDSGGGDDGGDSGGGDGGDHTEPFTFWVFEGKGTKVIIKKWLKGSDSLFSDVTLTVDSYDSSGTWYKFDVYSGDFFDIDAEPLPGYKINTYSFREYGVTYILNYEPFGLHYYQDYDNWAFSASDNVDPYIYARATKIDSGDVSICIGNKTGYDSYQCLIDNGETFELYDLYIYSDSSWKLMS